MQKFFHKAAFIIIFPTLFLTAAFPFGCSLSSDGGVYKSQDNGVSWTQKVKISSKQTIGGKDILSLAIDPLNPVTLYAGTSGSSVFKSTDKAETWTQVVDKNNVLDKRADVYDIAIDPKNSSSIYLAVFQNSFGRVLKTDDGGQSWREIYVVSQQKLIVKKISVDNFNDSILYIGTSDGGMFKSVDYGASWKALGWFGDGISDIKIDPKNDETVYFLALSKGVYKSIDQGQNWQSLKKNIVGSSSSPFGGFGGTEKIMAMAINPFDSRNLYAASEKGLLSSSDGGQSWKRLNILMPSDSVPILSLAQDQKNPAILYYGAGSAVYKTTNYGQTWIVEQVPSGRKVNVIKIDPLSPYIIYVGMHE